MKLVVLGAAGKAGRRVVDAAAGAGHDVLACARRPGAITPREGVTVHIGEVTDIDDLAQAVTGADAVVNCIGPVLSLRSIRRDDTTRTTLPAIVTAMRRAGVARLVQLSAFGVGDTRAKASVLAKFTSNTAMRAIYHDKDFAESQLTASGLNWTTVHPALLAEGPVDPHVTVVPLAAAPRLKGLPKTSFATIGQLLVDVAARNDYAGEKLVVVP
ncbi:NAD(P)-dependent oxidoreductase [Rhodococcus sp. NPDC003348]